MAVSMPDRLPAAPPWRRPLALVVMGVSGSGKSTLGARLAETLGVAFIEGDDLHDAASIAAMRAGQPLGDADRWPWLDRVGAAMRGAIAERGGAVAACSALRHAYRDRLAAAIGTPPHIVLLDGNRDTLRHRLEERRDHYMPASLLSSQLATLERPDAREDALALDADRSVADLCRDTIAWLATP